MTRRVVTGLDAEGRSTILVDGPELPFEGNWGGMIWRTDSVPADNSAQEDCPPVQFGYDQMHAPGSFFMVLGFEPGQESGWHATDTIDYIVMIEGEIVLEVETGEVTLRPGDCFVDRGVNHRWRNASGAHARMVCIALPAHPVGKGATV